MINHIFILISYYFFEQIKIIKRRSKNIYDLKIKFLHYFNLFKAPSVDTFKFISSVDINEFF